MISLTSLSHRNIYYFILHVLVLSLLFSKAGISICLVLLFGLSLFRISHADGLRIYINKEFFRSIKNADQRLLYLSLMFIFGLTIISGVNSENITAWLHFVRIKLPYLILPLIFLNHPPVAAKIYRSLLLTLIASVFLSSLWVIGHYLLNTAGLIEQISSGKSLLTPLTHVKYSVLLSLSIISAICLAIEKKVIWSRYWTVPLYLIAAFLIITIHVLSARTGLLALYAVGGVMLILYLIKLQHYKMIILITMIGLSAPIIAYHTIPSFYHKYHYMKHDIQMIKEGKADNYSDGERLRSINIGLSLWKENPLIGTGIGDLRDLCNLEYQNQYPKSTKKILPHNQYVMYLSGYGLLGLFIFLLLFCYPLFHKALWSDPYFISLFFILMIYGLVEKPLDEYVFITIHSLLFCLAFSFSKR